MALFKRSSIIFLAPLLTFIISFGLFCLALVSGWFGPSQDVSPEFCEAMRSGLIKQPANTWSNFGFIAAGLLIGWQLARGKYSGNINPLTKGVFYASFYASLVVYLGPGSMAMHATGTNIGGFFDMLSMYLLAAFVSSYALQRFFRLTPFHFILLFCFVLATCLMAGASHYHFIFSFLGDTAFMFYILVCIFVETLNVYVRRLAHRKLWGALAVAAVTVAFIIWNISQTGTSLCDPYSPIQGHAIWHLLDAVSVFFLFLYYVSEHKESSDLQSA